MRITAPYFTDKQKRELREQGVLPCEVKLRRETDPRSLGTQHTAVIEINGNDLATISMDERGRTRIVFTSGVVDYVVFKGVKLVPIGDEDYTYCELQEVEQ